MQYCNRAIICDNSIIAAGCKYKFKKKLQLPVHLHWLLQSEIQYSNIVLLYKKFKKKEKKLIYNAI